ncbi:LysR family transcriptional regulator [Thaumasiovibrio subtropicus]|nr:LysR family transcriptional regulator [Thaumasiovibrio subtropicus]
MLNPSWLNTYITLVETGHFTETAKKCFMTQPGVTQHVHKLEAALGYALLNRHGKQFELTLEGEKLYRYALTQRQSHQQFLDSLNDSDPYAGVCQIACSGAVAMQIYPTLIAKQTAHPELQIRVEAAPNRRIFAMLQSNEIAFGIVTQQPNDSAFTAIEVGEQPLTLFVPSRHASTADFEALALLGYIAHPDADHYLDRILGANFPDHYRGMTRIPQRGYVNQINQILLPVAAGLGFTALPAKVGESMQARGDIARLPLKVPSIDPLYLVYKTHRQSIQRYLWLEPLVKDLLR